MLKKLTLLILMILIITDCLNANQYFNQVLSTKTDSEGRPKYHKDRIYLKIKSDVQFQEIKSDKSQSKILKFGIMSIDSILTKFKTDFIEPTFKLNETLPPKVTAYIQKNKPEIPDISRIYTVKVPDVINVQSLLRELNNNPNIEYAELVPMDYLLEVPNDTLYSFCQHLPQIMAEEAWALFKGEQSDSTVIIGICDTGTNYNHEDLFGNLWQNLAEDANDNGTVMIWDDSLKKYVFDPGDVNGIDDDGNGYIDDFIGWDFVEDYDMDTQGNNPDDYNNHGTHVAGITSGVTNNKLGIASASWNVKYLPTSHSSPNFNNILRGFEGIVYLAQMGCDVINCSWGGGGYSQTGADAISYASSIGSIVVCAAGNSNSYEDFYPSAYPKVISVSSVASSDKKAGYSNYGRCVDISAPGGDNSVDGGIMSCVKNGGYMKFQGTSMASPVAASVIGYLKAYRPNWTNEQIITQIIGSADYIDTLNPKYINMLGSGRVNAYRALTETNINIPKTLKLGLMTVNSNDEISGNGNKAIEPGENIRLSFLIRNYALLTGSENTKLTITTNDEDITIINNSVNTTFNPDDYTETPFEIEIKIADNAVSKFVKFTLLAESEDAEILLGQTMNFEIPINAGGILIWEGLANGRGFSGNFIRNFLEGQGIDALYSNTFPTSMVGFDAVFLSFGSIGSNLNSYSFNDWMAEDVVDYLKAGGKLYIETMDGLGWDQSNNTELLQLLGIDSTDDGSDKIHTVDSLFGQDGSIMAGLVYKGTSFTGFQSVDILKAGGTGIPALVEPYTDAVIQHTGQFGQRTVTSVYPVSELIDRNHPNTRYEFIKRVMDFFGLKMDYTIARFSYNPRTGHAPLTVNFTDVSYTSKDVEKWEWNFDGSGLVTADKKTTQFIYETPGDYVPYMNVYNGITYQDTTNPLYVFDGESAAFFNNTGRGTLTDTTFNITGAFSIEAWINPITTGQLQWGRIVDKDKIIFMMNEDNSLRLIMYHENTEQTEVTTSPNSITFNAWQHVAATFDGDSTVHIYINGNDMALTYIGERGHSTISGNKDNPLNVGNRQAQGRAFHGKIDEMRIWDIVRTQDKIRTNLIKKISGTESNLLAYWRFEEGNGTSIEDKSGNGRKLTLSAEWRQGWHPGRITKQPLSIARCTGENVEIEVDVIEDGAELTYQWYKDGNPLTDWDPYSGTEQKKLSISSINSFTNGSYWLEITNDKISYKEISLIAGVYAKTLPKIKLQPEKYLAPFTGDGFEISVIAENESAHIEQLNFEWFNDEKSTGIFTPVLRIESANDSTIGNYWCKVSNECGWLSSDTCLVTLFVGVEEQINDDIQLFINPHPAGSNSSIFINNPNNLKMEIAIINSLGIEIIKMNLTASEQSKNINLTNYSNLLSSGLYYIRVQSAHGSFSKPFIYMK
jgi:hypothetical protein